jgi:arsenate reductase-like glutaredoxin family protein
MNIQIFGKQKCSDTKKAERFFKERKINFQFIEIDKYGISKGEYLSIKNTVGSIEDLIDKNSKEYESQYIGHLSSQDDVEERLLANPGMFITPIVRDGKKATVGYQHNVWAGWIAKKG